MIKRSRTPLQVAIDIARKGTDEAGGLAGCVDLTKLERLLDIPGQDLTGFVPALIERVREAETALKFRQAAIKIDMVVLGDLKRLVEDPTWSRKLPRETIRSLIAAAEAVS